MTLAPCPQCGSTEVLLCSGKGDFWGMCWICSTEGPFRETEEEAAKEWNTRTPWLPIDTCPKDGSKFLVLSSHGEDYHSLYYCKWEDGKILRLDDECGWMEFLAGQFWIQLPPTKETK